MRTSAIGYAAQALGAGRVKKSDSIDPAVGLIMKKRVGDPIEKGEVWCELRVSEKSDVRAALRLLDGALGIGAESVAAPGLIHAVIE